MKKILILACATAMSTSAMAQYEGMTTAERISAIVPEDSAQVARGHVSTFQMAYQNQDWNEAYISWKWLMQNAPCAISGMYKGQAPFMLYSLITKATDNDKKLQYFKDLMLCFEKRAELLPALNSMEKNETSKSTLGDVLAMKADYYNWTAPSTPGSGYTLNESYRNYSEAIKMINEKGGREIEGSVLQNFFLVSDAMYKSAPNALREQYLQDYLDSKEACEKMLDLAKEAQANGDEDKAQKLVAKYDAPLALIEQTFAQSGAADHDQIIAIYTKKFDDYKTDINKLNSAINLMQANDCSDADIYYQYAEAAYQISPTFTSAIGLAQKAQKDRDAAKCMEYYNKALELATTDRQRGNICINIAKALSASGSIKKSTEYCEKAIAYDQALAGRVYFQQANNLVRAMEYKEAISYCDKAAAADITYANPAARMKEQLQKHIAAVAANAKAQAEYAAFKKRQAEEEAFWGGKK